MRRNPVETLSAAGTAFAEEQGVQASILISKCFEFALANDLTDLERFATIEQLTPAEVGELERAADLLRTWGDTGDSLEAQVVDPVSVAALGLVLIGLVLAARVAKVEKGSVSFYQGLPDSLIKVIKTGLHLLQ